jgi:hypothetical protein
MSNGEKQEFLEKVKLFVKLFFSKELLMEVASDMQAEYEEDQLRRHAAKHEKRNGHQHNGCPNEA